MRIVDKLARIVLAIAGTALMAAIMCVESETYLPLIVGGCSALYILAYLFGWKKVLVMTASPLKEIKKLINCGVSAIRIDYRRIPKCWHIVVEEELHEAGYHVAKYDQNISLWIV